MRMRFRFAWVWAFALMTACTRMEPADDPVPAPFLLLDPPIRADFETTWETRLLPLFGRAEIFDALYRHVRRRGLRAPARLWTRVLEELPASRALPLALDALQAYPGQPPAPLREDRTAAELIRFTAAHAAAVPAEAPRIFGIHEKILKHLERQPDILDFRFDIRRAIVDALPELCPRVPGAADALLLCLLRMDLPAELHSRTLAAAGVCGFDDPQLADRIVEDLFRVRNRTQPAAFARAALSGARGAAREKLRQGLQRILTDPSERRNPPFSVLGILNSPLHRKDFAPEIFRDPSLIPQAFARLLADMGEHQLAADLVRSTHSVEKRPETAPEAFDALWETLMEAADVPEQWLMALRSGSDVALRAVVLDAAMRKCPDSLLAQLRSADAPIDVGQTEREWLDQLRDAALRRALADPARSAELTQRWNRETSEDAQWEATRELWTPFVQVPGESASAACVKDDPFDGMSPREWLQLRLALTLWVCRPTVQTALPSVDFLRQRVTAPDFTLPWNLEREERRRFRAQACMQERINALQAWEHRELDPCSDNFDCLWDVLVRHAPNWRPEALNRALWRLQAAAPLSAWKHFDARFRQVPYPVAGRVLEWAAPHLSRETRARIREAFPKTCGDDAECLSVWLFAIRLANEPEVLP